MRFRTIGVRHAQRHDLELAELAADFQREFLGSADIHLYWTASGDCGFGWHYDAEEVFVLDTAGTKDWELRKNTVHPWPLMETLPGDMKYQREVMPMLALLVGCRRLAVCAGRLLASHLGTGGFGFAVGGHCRRQRDRRLRFPADQVAGVAALAERLPSAAVRELPDPAAIDIYCSHLADLGRDLAAMLAQPGLARDFLGGLSSRFEGHPCRHRKPTTARRRRCRSDPYELKRTALVAETCKLFSTCLIPGVCRANSCAICFR